MDVGYKTATVYDPLYGFIHLTPVEREIIFSPFYQRLRWIKQLGFSSYVFPGAEHSRYGHSIGVMENGHRIIQSCGRAVTDEQLMDPSDLTPEKKYHQQIRLGALMHDLGTFCFSHTTEGAYIDFGETKKKSKNSVLKDDHENLGSFIIKNTDYPGGVTYILKKYGYDPQIISDLVKGTDPSIMANQILHSEIDCDRMDYLLRDAHYTGLKYGSYDRDYLLHHFKPRRVGNHDILTIKQNALNCIEDFLMSRFAWYSQVVRSPRGAKYDAIAEHICFFLLEKNLIYRYSDLLEMITNEPERFWGFNDSYFINLVHTQYMNGGFDKYPKIKNMAQTLIFAGDARHIQTNELQKILLNKDDEFSNQKLFKKIEKKVEEIEAFLKEKGSSEDWIISDLPKKEISFVKSPKSIIENKTEENVLLERDPVKISCDDGSVKLLAELDNSIISRLNNTNNYIPNVFVSLGAYKLLVDSGMIHDLSKNGSDASL
jgi:HD superfamily phosphohydrolase